MEVFTFSTHNEEYIWAIPVHVIAKLYAEIHSNREENPKLWDEMYRNAHKEAVNSPEAALEVVRNKLSWSDVAPFVRLYEPEQSTWLEYEWRKGDIYLGDYYEESQEVEEKAG